MTLAVEVGTLFFMDIKYRTNPKGNPRGLAIGLAFILFVAFTSPYVHIKDPDIQGIIVLFALTVLYAFFGIYLITDDVGIYKLDLFIFKRDMLYDEIQEVWYYQS